MSHSIGNVRLKAARQHTGFALQQALADALTRAAPQLGLGKMMISARQVRRWESATPPWPRADHQKLLVHVLHLPVEQLGFTPPWKFLPVGQKRRPQQPIGPCPLPARRCPCRRRAA